MYVSEKLTAIKSESCVYHWSPADSKGNHKFRWQEIEKVSYSPTFRWLKLKTYNKETLYISLFIIGFDDFSIMMDRLQAPKYQEALDKMDG